MSGDPGDVEIKGVREEAVPTKLQPLESLREYFRKLRGKIGSNQEGQFNLEPEMVKYREDHMKTIGSTEMGIQAEIVYEGTKFQNSFDQAMDGLLAYARIGNGGQGWRVEGDAPTYGRTNFINLDNGHKYQIIDETDKVGGDKMVSIRPDHFVPGRSEGAYYFSGPGSLGGRKIEICGAHMNNIDEAVNDIKEVVKGATEHSAIINTQVSQKK